MRLNPEVAKAHHSDFVKTCQLARKLGINQVNTLSGCPGSDPKAELPNWITCPFPAEDFLRPGVNIADVARVQNDVFRKYGYGDYTGPKYTRVRGHGLGLHCDENPWILEDVNYTVKEGMVLIAHPNTYLPLSGYMVFGDSLVVTAGGCVPLNHTERKLFQK